jgi:hypothetical protein
MKTGEIIKVDLRMGDQSWKRVRLLVLEAEPTGASLLLPDGKSYWFDNSEIQAGLPGLDFLLGIC